MIHREESIDIFLFGCLSHDIYTYLLRRKSNLKLGLVILSRCNFCYIGWNGLYILTAVSELCALRKDWKRHVFCSCCNPVKIQTNHCCEVWMVKTNQLPLCLYSTLDVHSPQSKRFTSAGGIQSLPDKGRENSTRITFQILRNLELKTLPLIQLYLCWFRNACCCSSACMESFVLKISSVQRGLFSEIWGV